MASSSSLTPSTAPQPLPDRVGPVHEAAIAHLHTLSRSQRINAFKPNFFKSEVPLTSIRQPALCHIYPAFQAEILAAYLRFTTFTVSVYVNYDAACKKFYDDERTDVCGKIIMHPDCAKGLARALVGDHVPSRVRLDIGTPFLTITHVNIRAKKVASDGWALAISQRPQTSAHELAIEWVERVCESIDESNLPDEQAGFGLRVLDTIAVCFLREPTRAEIHEKRMQSRQGYDNFYGSSSVWMNWLWDWGNEGYVELRRVKPCFGNCAVCPWPKKGEDGK